MIRQRPHQIWCRLVEIDDSVYIVLTMPSLFYFSTCPFQNTYAILFLGHPSKKDVKALVDRQ